MSATPLPSGTWVLLRGLMREHGHWGTFAELLRKRVDASLVLTPDLPGNGDLHRLDSPTSIDAMVQACRAQLRQHRVPAATPVHLLSISMGGMVAATWAHRHPDEVASLCVINSSMRPFSPFWDRLRPVHWPHILRLLVTGADDRAWETAILQMTSNTAGHDDALLSQWLQIRRLRPVSQRNALRQLWAAARFRAPDQPPNVPTMVLGSLGDRLVHPRCSQAIAQAWQARWRQHPDAGHDLPLDDPDWIVAQWLDWNA